MSATYCSSTGKIAYSRHAAGAAILAIIGKGKNRERMYPYRCRFCDAFHIGRTDPVSWRRRQERDKRRAG